MKSSNCSFFLVVMVMAGCETDDNCTGQQPINCDLVDISNEYVPVFGCDGVTYQNAGHAQCIGHQTRYTDGPCE